MRAMRSAGAGSHSCGGGADGGNPSVAGAADIGGLDAPARSLGQFVGRRTGPSLEQRNDFVRAGIEQVTRITGAAVPDQPIAGGQDRAPGEPGGERIAVKDPFVADPVRGLGFGEQRVEIGAVAGRHPGAQLLQAVFGGGAAQRFIAHHRCPDDLQQHLGMFPRVAVGDVVAADDHQTDGVDVRTNGSARRSRPIEEFRQSFVCRLVG